MAPDISENPSDMTIVRSSFSFHINYSKTKYLPSGECIASPVFTADGYDWILEFYPQGFKPKNGGSHVSVNLVLRTDDVERIKVEYFYEARTKHGIFFTIGLPKLVTYTSECCVCAEETFLWRDEIEDKYCLNGVHVIRCSIAVLSEPKVDQTYIGGLCDHIEEFWEKKEGFDVTFEVEGEIIPAHGFMLAVRSPVFKALLFGPMAEAKRKHIKIDEMRATVFNALLHFIYTDRLVRDNSSDQEDSTLFVESLQDLIVAADRYALDKLITLCEEQLERNLSVESVSTTLLLADRHSRAGLKRKCLEFASSPENYSQVTLTEGYMTIMHGSPSLVADLRQQLNKSIALLILQNSRGLVADGGMDARNVPKKCLSSLFYRAVTWVCPKSNIR